MLINPGNTAGKFTVQLPEILTPPDNSPRRGRWFMGLVEIALPPVGSSSSKWDVLHIFCPHVEGVISGSSYRPRVLGYQYRRVQTCLGELRV